MLFVQINISYNSDSFSCNTKLPLVVELNNPRSLHIEKMKSILATGHKSDITLTFGNQELKVHKFLLSLHSPVFEAMFSHAETKESIEKKVAIEDVTANAMKSLLTYIYTGEVEFEDKEQTLELFIAADKVFCLYFLIFFYNFYIFYVFSTK